MRRVVVARRRRPRSGRPPRGGVLRKAFYRDVIAAAEAVERNPGGRTAEDNLFRVAAEFERFVSEWMVRALADDSRIMSTRVEKDVATFLAAALAKWDGVPRYGAPTLGADAIRLSPAAFPAQPTLEQSRNLLGGYRNVTFETAADLRKQIERDLSYKYAARFRKVTPGELAVIESIRAIRDALAHGSQLALDRMNAALRRADMPADLVVTRVRRIGPDGIGEYLCDKKRFARFLKVLVSVVRKMDLYAGRPPDRLQELGLT